MWKSIFLNKRNYNLITKALTIVRHCCFLVEKDPKLCRVFSAYLFFLCFLFFFFIFFLLLEDVVLSSKRCQGNNTVKRNTTGCFFFSPPLWAAFYWQARVTVHNNVYSWVDFDEAWVVYRLWAWVVIFMIELGRNASAANTLEIRKAYQLWHTPVRTLVPSGNVQKYPSSIRGYYLLIKLKLFIIITCQYFSRFQSSNVNFFIRL